MNEPRSAAGSQQPLSRRERVDQRCDEFERLFQERLAANAQLPRIEDLLDRADPDDREHLLRELLRVELELRRAAGQPGTADDYRQRFAQYRQVIESVLDTAAFAASGDAYSTIGKGLTRSLATIPPIATDEHDDLPPSNDSRYQILKVLGRGGFAVVYLARDTQLDRHVALKVPRKDKLDNFKNRDQREAVLRLFADEARKAAQLDHSAIVRVYDVLRGEASVCIVQEYIDGVDLGSHVKKSRLPPRQCVELLIATAAAVGHAHRQGFVHRDLKPQNILVDSSGQPHVADFGLSLHESAQREHAGELAGTYPYMSPEQVRREAHRLDGRSDLWSLGVILYELLTGRLPFAATTLDELFDEILHRDPKPPRMLDPQVPGELSRICLACLAKRATDRYQSAADLIDDLRHWLDGKPTREAAGPTSSSAQPATVAAGSGTVIPKGLRSYDAGDAGFFLELLPGPPDREGLPKSVRFWKTRLEQRDADETFTVGLMYGPSGCGKSSLVKAALLPRLSAEVLSIYVEATALDTEVRLLKGLKKHCPDLPQDASLVELIARLRDGGGSKGKKVVLVLDQFEQWLHAHAARDDSQLIPALRQCDGSHVQSLVLVRDDFWMSATRFMQALEVPLVEGHNSAAVDLFDPDHAGKVLAMLGRGYGKLPASPAEPTADQQQFLAHAVSDIADEGKVVSVRLAVFAEMMKGRPWTTASLREVGGTTGVGVTFLEETFSATTAAPARRLHQQAARAVLKALLPDQGTEIKGQMRSYDQLLDAAGYRARPQDFAALLRILDSEVRLITPTEPDGSEKDEGRREKKEPRTQSRQDSDASHFSLDSSHFSNRYYQLTHDYLVPALRDWLTRKQRETRRGRAELKLEERSAIWNTKRENKQLPTVAEWLSIRVLADSKSWTESQRAMMGKAARLHGTMWGGLLLTVLLVGTGIQQWVSAERWKNLQEQTRAAAESLQNNLGPPVPVNIRELRRLPEKLVLPELQTRFTSATNPRHKLSLAFALAAYGELDAEYLASRIDDIAEADTRNYVTAFQANPANALVTLKAEALKCSDKSLWRRKAKLAIAALGLGDAELALDVCAFENRLDPEQRTWFIDEFPRWEIELKTVLDSVKNSDSPALRSGICLAVGQVSVEKIVDADKESWQSLASQWFVQKGDTSTHSAAGWLLRNWKSPIPVIPNPNEVTRQRDWFVVKTSGATMLRIRPSPADVSGIPNPKDKYKQQLAELETLAAAELEKPEYREERAVAYFETGKLEEALDDFSRLTKDGAAERQPTIHRYLTLTLARLGRAEEAKASLARYLESKDSASVKSYMQIQVPAWLGDIPEASRQLESAIKEASSDQDTQYNVACAAALCAQATAERDPDAPRQFRIRALDLLQKLSDLGYHKWDHLSQDPDFAILHGDPRFASILSAMKSPGEFWVADREVTRGQFEEFMNDAKYTATEKPAKWAGVDTTVSPTADHPAQQVSWYDAVMYCNWLSLREGLQPCYERTGTKEKVGYNNEEFDAWRAIPGATGYRLLYEAEWEYGCRAGTSTAFSSGDDEELLVAYCQMYPSKLTATCGEKLPNAWGLHDVHGNVFEWCWDSEGSYRVSRGGSWGSVAADCRSAFRYSGVPTDRTLDYGFRLALSPSGVSSPAEQGQGKGAEPAGEGTEGASAEQRPEMP